MNKSLEAGWQPSMDVIILPNMVLIFNAETLLEYNLETSPVNFSKIFQ